MAAKGYRVFFCTAPVLTSRFCAGEKFEWVRKHFGPEWVSRIILTTDKTTVRGDVLIDDKPRISGTSHPVWRQLMFNAPYNREAAPLGGRIAAWADWEAALVKALSGAGIEADAAAEAAAEAATKAEAASSSSRNSSASSLVTSAAVAQLPDFSHLLPSDYRKDYSAWRSGRAQGAKGEIEEAVSRMMAMQDSIANNTSDDFTEVNVYRTGYASWRRGHAQGAKGSVLAMSQM